MIYTNTRAFAPQTASDNLDNEFVFEVIPTGDAIAAATVHSDMIGMTCANTTIVGDSVITWITGGIAGQTATITCAVTTTMGRVYNRSATMAILTVV